MYSAIHTALGCGQGSYSLFDPGLFIMALTKNSIANDLYQLDEIFEEVFGKPAPDTVAGVLVEASIVSVLAEEEVCLLIYC